MIAPQSRRIVLLAIPVLAAELFVMDWFTPLGMTDWVLYVVPLSLSLHAGGRHLPYWLAGIFTALIVVGFCFSPLGMEPQMALINLFLSAGVLWVVAFLVAQNRRTTEEARKLSRAVEQNPASIMITDPAGNITYVNPKFTESTGYSFDEVAGRNPRLLSSGEMPSAEGKRLWETISSGKEWRGTFHNRKKNGELFWESASIAPVFNDVGRITHYLAVKEDITETKKLESQVLRLQRMESLGTLAGGIAHDLNNVLTPLMFSVEVLRDKVTDHEGREILNFFQTNVQRGASLVKQVLTFARGVEGERTQLPPARIAMEVGRIIQETFPKSIEFSSQTAPGLWTVCGDGTQLHQVLLNLAVNARDAMPNGGRLSIALENIVLDENYAAKNLDARPGHYVLMKVTDSGGGIPDEIRDRIFEPFFTTKQPGRGTGLGLSTTLGIVKSHGGFINCYSEVGRGTTFIVYLPADMSRAEAESAEAELTRLPRGHGELVLLVDDEEAIRVVAQEMMKGFGYRVLLASDGAEAIALYSRHRDEIAVVITDMAMPVMDGATTIQALRAMNPRVRIIASSGLITATESGVKHVVPKPYGAESMLRALHEVLAWTSGSPLPPAA